ncbi:uncharacterized protein TRIADDRAFT_53712 [Trichoplax adhaerens]|uniref:UNC93-like protein MFSD11 n=1 Tax=Trichoplax adhaerens TaxID=10228 RepID=B3RPY5_TRIAD|nr:hypothetical protein TRIADDRAFT_53712 [Trichoplax adhaerens]EDV28263.1 hypothetical protein TRIADDRAFT_53712 [Trichoplax adhaerens]|eukprot:XP_002110097.1 hypothetical protein TRIADDRAFT_53712 [Trichoplax adhaerens]
MVLAVLDCNEYKTGRTSLAILYGIFAISKWFGPIITDFLGIKLSCLIAGACYCFYMVSFIYPFIETIYIAAALTGLAGGVLWTAQANIVISSTDTKHSKRDGRIFWGCMQFSRLLGNVFLVWILSGTKAIGQNQRILLYIVLAVACGVGSVLLLFIFPTKFIEKSKGDENVMTETLSDKILNPFKLFHLSMKTFFNSNAVWLVFIFVYTGFAFGFYSTTYMTCIGNTKLFANPDEFIGIAGIILGIGEIIGGSLFGIAGEKKLCGRISIICIGLLFHLFSYAFIYFNVPFKSPFMETYENAFWGKPSFLMAATCAFFLGLGDSCFYSQIYSILGEIFESNSPLVFEVFTFIQSLSIAGFFLLSLSTTLHLLTIIIAAVGVVGVITFFIAEYQIRSAAKREL